MPHLREGRHCSSARARAVRPAVLRGAVAAGELRGELKRAWLHARDRRVAPQPVRVPAAAAGEGLRHHPARRLRGRRPVGDAQDRRAAEAHYVTVAPHNRCNRWRPPSTCISRPRSRTSASWNIGRRKGRLRARHRRRRDRRGECRQRARRRSIPAEGRLASNCGRTAPPGRRDGHQIAGTEDYVNWQRKVPTGRMARPVGVT
jgi:hypothetical protein